MYRLQNFIIYSIIGASGATIDFLLFLLLSQAMPYYFANVISVSIGITNNFYWNARFNFRVKTRIFSRFISFFSVGLFGLFLSTIGLWALIDLMKISSVVAKMITIIFVVAVQYTLNTLITFRKGKSDG